MKLSRLFLCGFAVFSGALHAEEPKSADDSVRKIHLRMDDAQTRFESCVFPLKYASAEEVLPFVSSAVLRYNRNSTIRQVPASAVDGEALLVSTGVEFMPYVQAIIEALDRPGKKESSAIEGTGVSRIAYTPQYRGALQFKEIIDKTLATSAGTGYINEETNTIFWRDQTDAAKQTLAWVRKLDQPIPQIHLRLNYYELRDSDLKDWGFDFLAWKNGPGVNLFNAGYNAGHIAMDQVLEQLTHVASASWGYGGFFTAPQIDMSFIRCLQQSGSASVGANAELTVLNTPVTSMEDFRRICEIQDKNPETAPYIYRISMQPEYQNIAKNTLGRTVVGKSYYVDADGNVYSDPPALEAQIVNPFICRPKDGPNEPGGVIFDYSLYFKNVIERGNTGAELSNSVLQSGSITLGFGVEKVLAVYEKENDVEQTIGIPILCRIPYIRYLFSTVTSIKERTYIVVTAESVMIDDPNRMNLGKPESRSGEIKRRIEDPFRKTGE